MPVRTRSVSYTHLDVYKRQELFIKMLHAAAKDAHRQLRQIEVKQQAPDHPILWGVPETNYLKFFLFQVI